MAAAAHPEQRKEWAEKRTNERQGLQGKTKQVEGGSECSLANKSLHISRHFGVRPSH